MLSKKSGAGTIPPAPHPHGAAAAGNVAPRTAADGSSSAGGGGGGSDGVGGGAEKSGAAAVAAAAAATEEEERASVPAQPRSQRHCLTHSAGDGDSSAARGQEEGEDNEDDVMGEGVEGTENGREKGGELDGNSNAGADERGGGGGGSGGGGSGGGNIDSEDDVVAAGAALSALSTAPHPHKPLVSHLPSQKVADAKRVQDNVFLTTVSSPARPIAASPPARSPPAASSAPGGGAASGGATRGSGAGGGEGARGAGGRAGDGGGGGASGGGRGKKGPRRGAGVGGGGGMYSFGDGASKVFASGCGWGCMGRMACVIRFDGEEYVWGWVFWDPADPGGRIFRSPCTKHPPCGASRGVCF